MINIGSKIVFVGGVNNPDSHYLNGNYIFPNGNPNDKNSIYVVGGFYIGPNGELGLKIIGFPVFWARTSAELGWDAREYREIEEQRLENELNFYKSREEQLTF